MTKQRRFYVPEDYQQLIDKLIRILRREGKSLSRWILENAIEYVKRHEPGNPQMLMNKFLKKAQPEPEPVAQAPAPPKGPCRSCAWLDKQSFAPRGFCRREKVIIAAWALEKGHGCDMWREA